MNSVYIYPKNPSETMKYDVFTWNASEKQGKSLAKNNVFTWKHQEKQRKNPENPVFSLKKHIFPRKNLIYIHIYVLIYI